MTTWPKFLGSSVVKNPFANARDAGSKKKKKKKKRCRFDTGLRRGPGEANGNPL